jgi:hypothetical protein
MTYATTFFAGGFACGIVSFLAAIGLFSWMQRRWDKEVLK